MSSAGGALFFFQVKVKKIQINKDTIGRFSKRAKTNVKCF